MTIDNVLEILEKHKLHIPSNVFYELKADIVNFEDPTTKNDLAVDCISREQAQTKIEMNASRYTIARERGGMGQVEWSDQLIKVSDAVDIIRDLPSVTPIRPKGHWISHREHCENLGVVPSGLGAYEWCSNCDCGIDVREWHRNHYNYCPNCGADMSEVDE